MATRQSGSSSTIEVVDFDTLNLRIEAFALDPIAETLARLESADLQRLASSDPELAARLASAREKAEELAVDAFDAASEDTVEMALYLIDLCAPEAVFRLAARAQTEVQLRSLGEYMVGRFRADTADDEYVAGNMALLEIIRSIALNQAPPGEGQRTPSWSSAPSAATRLYETVIVHGTNAKSGTWWREQPGVQNFWAYIKQACPALYGAGQEFSWSGGFAHSDREQGARDFIDWWNNVGAPKPLQVVAHSHGSNVVYVACAMEPKLHIVNMVSLGAPARTWYPPPIANGSRIERLHNIYSRFDTTQLLGSLGGRRGEGRTLGDGVNVCNHHIPWEDPRTQVVQVWHKDLHEEGVWHGNGLAKKTLL